MDFGGLCRIYVTPLVMYWSYIINVFCGENQKIKLHHSTWLMQLSRIPRSSHMTNSNDRRWFQIEHAWCEYHPHEYIYKFCIWVQDGFPRQESPFTMTEPYNNESRRLLAGKKHYYPYYTWTSPLRNFSHTQWQFTYWLNIVNFRAYFCVDAEMVGCMAIFPWHDKTDKY